MKKLRYIFPALFISSLGIVSQAHAGFSISIAGKNVNLADPGELNSGEKLKNNIGVPSKGNHPAYINTPTIGTNDFDINMSKPVTTEADVKRQAEKSCIALGENNPNHEPENIIRAKCHMLNMDAQPELPALTPILNHNADEDDEAPKKYKPHFEIGEIKVQETKIPVKLPEENKDDISSQPLQPLKADRSCDITRDLRVMLSPKCLNKSEAKAQQNIGNGTFKDVFANNVVSKDITEHQDNENPKYLCHIDFINKLHRGFVQGYTASPNQCIHSAMILHGVRQAEIFDHMGYLVKRYINKRN